MATTASCAAIIIGLLTTYCYRVPSVLAIPERKDIYVEDDWPLRRSYQVEDFLWSGSGDGQQDGGSGDPGGGGSTWRTTTIVRTTTILTTVYPTPVYTMTIIQEYPSQTPSPCSEGVCTSEVDLSWSEQPYSVHYSSVEPTPTFIMPSPTVQPTSLVAEPDRNDSVVTPDQRFWLLTVLRVNTSLTEPPTTLLETRLAQLYKVAFNRQQERHFGINNVTPSAELKLRRARDHRVADHVVVHVHNRTSKYAHELELVYTVHVGGKPVLAVAAAEDMKLVSNTEVTAELGYPVITKAEPYLKGPLPLEGDWKRGRARDTWLLAGAAVAAVSLLLVLILLLTISLSKRKCSKRRVLAHHTQQEGGTSNLAYEGTVDLEGEGQTGASGNKTLPLALPSPVIFRDDIVASQKRKGSCTSLSSGESSGTLLVRRRPGNRRMGTKIQELREKKSGNNKEWAVGTVQVCPEDRQKVTNKLTKTVHSSHIPMLNKDRDTREMEPDDMDTSDEQPRRDSPPVKPRVGTAVSPNSFLSMPSIKAFPRGANIPEPLARVLEPMNVRPIDCGGGNVIAKPVQQLARHGSMEGEDPGVIGPLVWDLHCHRVQHPGSCDGTIHDLALEATQEDTSQPDMAGSSVGRMRRRFHELLDDAFSLFGSRSGSPGAEDSSSPPTLHRVNSAIVRPVGEPLLGPSEVVRRPQTSDCHCPATAAAALARPRGAWGTCSPSPQSRRSGTLPRPLSAGPFHRPQLPGPVEIMIDRTLVLSDSQLTPSDPAIPLIAAIKEELRKFQGTNIHPAISLPGSTSMKP